MSIVRRAEGGRVPTSPGELCLPALDGVEEALGSGGIDHAVAVTLGPGGYASVTRPSPSRPLAVHMRSSLLHAHCLTCRLYDSTERRHSFSTF